MSSDFGPYERLWFSQALDEGPGFTEPYEDAAGSGLIMTATVPFDSGEDKGFAAADIRMQATKESILKILLRGRWLDV